jgi:uncharacterized C2H2 Zn-finger protein
VTKREAECPRCGRLVRLDDYGRFVSHGPDPRGGWLCHGSWVRPKPDVPPAATARPDGEEQ